jgi:hypothetical protein
MLEFPVADAGSADNEAAIGDGIGNGGELLGTVEQRGGADGGPGFAESNVVWVDHAKAGEAEVGHRAGGSADVERVASGNQDHAQVVFWVGGYGSIVTPRFTGRTRDGIVTQFDRKCPGHLY